MTRADVRMIQAGNGVRLTFEPFTHVWIAGEMFWKDLYCDSAIEARIFSAVVSMKVDAIAPGNGIRWGASLAAALLVAKHRHRVNKRCSPRRNHGGNQRDREHQNRGSRQHPWIRSRYPI